MNIQGTPTVMDFHPQEVARQFSVNQFELFKQINIPKLITRCCESAPKPFEASLVGPAAVASQIDLLVKAQENVRIHERILPEENEFFSRVLELIIFAG